MNIKRGNIYITNLDPVIGNEMAKTRPVVVVSNNTNNQYSGTITVLPITSQVEKVYPFEVLVPKGEANLTKDSKIKADQIRTLDRDRLVKCIGTLTETYMEKINTALAIHLDIT